MAFTHSSLRLLPLFSLLLSTSAALPSKPSIRQVAPSYTSLGCFKDNEGGQRALGGGSYAADDMTVASCASFCSKFELFAVSYGRECYCGHSVTGGNTEVDAADCYFPCAGNPDEKCGAGNRVNLYTNDNPSVRSPASLPGITSLGCFVDNTARILPNNIIGADDMTAARCALNCAGYDFFGTQWSRECFCGSILPTEQASASDCSMPCSGDDNELCGAGMRLNVYSFDKELPPTSSSEPTPSSTSSPTPISTIDGYKYQGCFTDNVPQRVLGGKTVVDGAMTLELCASSCKDGGYTLFGVQYSAECFCGTSLDAASVQVADSECGMPCSGDQSQRCGDANRLSLFADPTLEQAEASNVASIGEFIYRSCWTDELGNRSLSSVVHRTDDMTVAKCADTCQDHDFFGLQFGRECYCGDGLGGQAAPETDCSMLCVGLGNNWCGGPFRLNLYAKETGLTATTIAIVESSTASLAEVTTVSETTTTIEESSVTVSETLTISTEEPTISTEEPSVSTEDSTTSTTETPTSSIIDTPTSSIVEASTTFDLSTTLTTVSSTSTGESSTVFPTSTTASSSSTTTLNPSVTITRCPPGPTYVGQPEMCYDFELPYNCEVLRSTLYTSQSMSWSLFYCQGIITRYGLQPNPGSCFPTSTAMTPPDAAAATSTMRSVYSCLRDSYICTKAMTCVTSTYPVGQVPTPTPSIGVELFTDPGFESGQLGDWTLAGDVVRMPAQISPWIPKSGNYSYQIQYQNNGYTFLTLSQRFKVEPARLYRFKVNLYITNSLALNTFQLASYPQGYVQQFPLTNTQAGVWREVSIYLSPMSSWVELQIQFTGTPRNIPQYWEGQNNIFIDDVSLMRMS
ncbi:WSC domain-containing protein [Triangularia verruculosa]|uniref:WSC domain-containing protein n=1 Tax=Triangularia verruculosa TaxID=2587418 RepID=A0AAN6XNJ1_9PEZI|nr:WSC domain-containing protein [Triangularia verruculosa]